ncbi:MAG TPA: cytochrome b [Rhizomicrobium sp.]|nr:cytochrome b [Rhizomicrobium sp.]
MSARDSQLRYGSVSIGFHWLIAGLVILNLCLGLYMGTLPRGDALKGLIVMIHKSTGLTILTLSVARVLWRLVNPWQPLPVDLSPALRALARTTHLLFYFLIIAIPFSGWAMTSASLRGAPIIWYGLFEWPKLGFITALSDDDKRQVMHNASQMHEILAFFAIGLIVLHVGAALYHHLIRRDSVLRRMLPG